MHATLEMFYCKCELHFNANSREDQRIEIISPHFFLLSTNFVFVVQKFFPPDLLTKPARSCVHSAQPEFMYVYSCCGTYKDLILKKQRLSNQTGDVLDVEIFFFFSLHLL